MSTMALEFSFETSNGNTIKNLTNLSIGTANPINSEIRLNADYSILEGRVNTAQRRNVFFHLKLIRNGR